MHDFDVNKLNELEFDTMLQSSVPELLPDDIARSVTPWRKAMKSILTGFALCAITLNFFALNYLLPAIGMVLILLGFRTLRRENGWFAACWGITILRCVCFFSRLILNTTIYQETFYATSAYEILSSIGTTLIFLLYICFWRGLCSVKQKAGLEPRASGAISLIIWNALIYMLIGLGITNSFVVGFVLMVAYICIIRSLVKLSKELDEAGYCICIASIKVTDRAIAVALTALVLIGCACGYLFFDSYPMEWKAYAPSDNRQVRETKEHLVSLDFPEHILDDLTEEDILACKDAIRVVVMVNDFPVNDGHKVIKQGPGYSVTHRVYDQKELRIIGIGVELPGEQEYWKLIHHFQWVIDPGFYGTELIHLWPAHRDPNGWLLNSGFTGQLLYNEGDQVYTAPYISISDNVYEPDIPSSNEYDDTDVLAEFSLPAKGENKRGYISYTVRAGTYEGYIESCINYTHQMTWLQYPVISATQKHMQSNIFDTPVFETLQDQLLFLPSEME